MNTNRFNAELAMKEYLINHPFHISPYWLLGFVEGDGSFYVENRKNKPISLTFKLTQSSENFTLMEAISEFFNRLPHGNIKEDPSSFVYLYRNPSKPDKNHKELTTLLIRRCLFIKQVLIPFFDTLFLTK